MNAKLQAVLDLGNMFVDEDGFLMCGPEKRSTSMVDGIRCEWLDTETLELNLQMINDLGTVCGEFYRRKALFSYRPYPKG